MFCTIEIDSNKGGKQMVILNLILILLINSVLLIRPKWRANGNIETDIDIAQLKAQQIIDRCSIMFLESDKKLLAIMKI